MTTDVIVLCLDVGPSMDTIPHGESETALEKSIRVARQITQQKMFAGSKDLLGLVLFGTAATDNELAETSGGYENITVAYRPAQPTVDFLKFLTNQKPGGVSADFIDAIVVALDLVVKYAKDIKRVGSKKIYLISDMGSEYSDDQLDSISHALSDNDVEFIVVGPSISTDGEGGGGGDGPGHSRPPHPSSSSKKTPQQLAGEAVIARLVEAVDGAYFSFSEALQVATFIRKNAKKQTTTFSGCLEIGDKMKISCKMFTKTMLERPATWKKLSAVSQAANSSGTMSVKAKRSYHLNDEEETEVELENIAKGYRYGRSLIPISEADEQAMKQEVPRCLSLLGFTEMKHIQHHQLLGSSVKVVVANPDDQHAGKAMSALIHALYETNKAGVTRYVWRKNSQPKLTALIPKIKADSEYLLMVQLPFMEDTRQFVFGSLPGERKNAAPSDEQLNAIDNLISNMDLMKARVDEDGIQCEALKPKKTCNPIIQRTFQCIAHRALNPDDPLPDAEESLKQLLEPDPAVMVRCAGALQRIKELFPLEKIVRKSKEDGTGAAEVWNKTAPAAKKARDDGSEEVDFNISMASLARGEVTKVGTLDPVSDFKSLIAKKNADFAEASRQLQSVAFDLVKESFGDALYEKALDCVKVLRQEVIKCSKPELFNSFLRRLKDDMIGTRYFPFWEKVVSEGISLISSTECGVSTVTQEEAVKFVEDNTVTDEPPPPTDEDMEDPDNLLELM